MQGTQNLLDRHSLSASSRLTATQLSLDQTLQTASVQASDPIVLTSLFAGQIFRRAIDVVASPFLSSFLNFSGAWTRQLGVGTYKTLKLAGEAASFEFSQRALRVEFQGGDSNLLAWEGAGGLRNGLVHSTFSFFILHGFGKVAADTNVVFRHTLQSTGMVTANQIAGAFDIAPASQESIVAQLAEAEIFNIQQQGSASLLPVNRFSTLENLFLESPQAVQKSPLFTETGFVSSLSNLMGKEAYFQSSPKKIVALGDIHTKWSHVQKIMDHEFPNGNGVALAVGDLQSYPELQNGHRIYFIAGNHDNPQRVAELHTNQNHPNFTPLLAGEMLRLGALKVAGIPGVFSPHFFAQPEKAPLIYLTHERIEAVKRISTPIDILLMHDAPEGVGFQKNGADRGDPLLRGVMESLQPALVLFGHHHQFFEGQSGSSRIVGLDYPKRSYVVIDTQKNAFSLRYMEADLRKVRSNSPEFQYPWERDIVFEGRKLFEGEKIMTDKKEGFREKLETHHREKLVRQLSQVFLEAIPITEQNRETFAKRRALLAANTALEYAAEYAAFMDANPQASLAEKKSVVGNLYDRMSAGVPPHALPDIIRAFETYLKYLGIVNS